MRYRVEAEEVEQSIDRVRSGAASPSDFVTLVALFEEVNELVADRSGEGVDRAEEVEEACAVLMELVQQGSPPPMALWALGLSENRDAVGPLVEAVYAAAEVGDETLAIQALRSAAGLAPRSLRHLYIDRDFPDMAALKAERRHQGQRRQSAVQNDLFGLAPWELFAVATGPAVLASGATNALAQRLRKRPPHREPEAFRQESHHPVAWSPADREEIFLACLEYLGSTDDPEYGVIYAVEVAEDPRAAQTLSSLVRRSLATSPHGAALYRSTIALGECGGVEYLDLIREVQESLDPHIRHTAKTVADRLSRTHYWFSPNEQLHRHSEERRFSDVVRALADFDESARLNDIGYSADRPIELDDIPRVVKSWLGGEAGHTLEARQWMIRLWPVNGRRVRIDAEVPDPLFEIIRSFGFEISEL